MSTRDGACDDSGLVAWRPGHGSKAVVQRAIQEVALRGILAEERIKTGVTFYPMGDAFYADPYTQYRRLREKDPVHHSRLINGWVLTRYADVDAALRDPAKYSSDERKQLGFEKNRQRALEKGIIDETDTETFSMLRIDPPDHTRLRSLVSRAFTRRAPLESSGSVSSTSSNSISMPWPIRAAWM